MTALAETVAARHLQGGGGVGFPHLGSTSSVVQVAASESINAGVQARQ